jgi:excisionase family DNA binding protein
MTGRMVQWSDLPLVLTSEQVAAVLQLKRRTVANMLGRGELQGVRVGKSWRVSRTALMQFVGEDGRDEAEAKIEAEAPVEALRSDSARSELQAQAKVEIAEDGPAWEHDAILNIIGLGAGGPPDLSSRHHEYLAQALEEEWHRASS